MTIVEQAKKIRADLTTVLGTLTDEQRGEVVSLHRLWLVGDTYSLGEVLQHGGALYRIEQPTYTAAEHEVPGAAGLDALFTALQPGQVDGGIIAWFEPTATNYYRLGDMVRYTDGKVYESIYDGANVWSPLTYPAAWRLV